MVWLMAYLYIGEKRKEIQVARHLKETVPDVEGLGRWRWIASAPWWYF